ncbi:MAG: hypothetical protein EA383_02255 [Spirochaetaceae bacterium]|nr:MAG: hypothetical protein EA383_02255 [Spirochaetaceae bacterium]
MQQFLSLVSGAWKTVVRLQRPLLYWNFITIVIAVIVIAPLSSIILGLGLFRGGELVIGNLELIDFMASPRGIAYLVLAGSLTIITYVIRFAGTSRIVLDATGDHRPSVFRTALLVFGYSRQIAVLCVMLVVAAMLLALPFLGALWAVYVGLISEFDINYYLTAQPTEWVQTLVLGTGIIAIGCMTGLYFLYRLLFAIPILVDRDEAVDTTREAVRRSWKITRPRKAAGTIASIAVCGLLWIVLRLAAFGLINLLSGRILAGIAARTADLRVLAIAAGAGGTISFLTDFALNFFGFSLLVTLTTQIWLHHSGHTGATSSASVRQGIRAFTSGSIRTLRTWTSPRRLLPAILVLLVISVATSGRLVASLPDPADVVVSAHRAGPPPAPENTLAALEAAIRERADYSEIDLLRTSDGTIVIVHDEDLMRVAGDPRRVARTPFSELADVVQLPDDGSPESERRIATFQDFLERADGRIRLMVEFKYYGFDPDLVPQALEEIRAHGSEDQVIVMSLSLRAVQQAAELAPDIPRGYVTAATIGNMTRLPVDFVAVAGGRITPALLRDAAAAGIDVHAWTINSPAAVIDLIDRGVHGIITDYPEMAVQIRDQMSLLTPIERLLLRYGARVSVDEIHPTAPEAP